jgi:uncharacterized protein (UPF0335 family)
VSDEQVRSIIERVQRLQEEKRTIEEDIREVYQEARANGYDVKVLRAVVKHLGKDADEVAEFDAIFDLYLQAFKNGLASAGAGRATHAHEEADQSISRNVRPANASVSHVDRSASAQPHSAQGEPAIPFTAGDAGTGQASANDTSTAGRPSGAGTGSDVRAVAPITAKPKAPEIDLTIPAFLDRRIPKPDARQ